MLLASIMELEKIMSKSTLVLALIAGVSFAAASSAQTQQQERQPAASGGNAIDSGTANKKMDEEGNKGNPGNQSGTLMDKRSKAMSPSGASSPGRSGEVRQ
jgi:opacity protein-like surface antigen